MGDSKNRGFFGRLWHGIFVIVTSYLALVGLLVTVLAILLGVLIANGISQQQKVSSLTSTKHSLQVQKNVDRSLLRIKVDRPIVSRQLDEKDRWFNQLFNDKLPISLHDLETTLRRASDDARVLGLLLEISTGSGDFSTLTALRRALESFAGSQKPIFVSLDDGDTALYYLASVAQKISISPLGGLAITGPAFQLTYFGSALEKLGVQLEVLKAGKFKSAMESFAQDQPSPETLEMYQALESSLRATVTKAVAAQRKHSEAEVNAWLRRSIFTSGEALKGGLVDRVGYLPEWEEELKTEVKAERIVDAKVYLKVTEDLDKPKKSASKDGIALIEAEGEISMSSSSSRDGIAPQRLTEELQWAAQDEHVKAVVMRINSPGGSALASDLIWNEVQKLAAKKPLVVSMGAVAASGGYYIAAPAALIFAESTTITGSIGVIGAVPKALKFAEKWGINFHLVTASDRRGYLNLGSKSSDEDKKILGESIKFTYDTFVEKVALGRKQTPERIYQIAEGRVYTGAEALSLGLVDRLGGLKDAVKAAQELAKFDTSKIYELQQYEPEAKTILECIQGGEWLECMAELNETDTTLRSKILPLPAGLAGVQNFKTWLESGELLAYWPGAVLWRAGRGLNQED